MLRAAVPPCPAVAAAALLAALAAAPAHANPLFGVWSIEPVSQAACDEGSETRLVISEDELRFHESTCAVTSFEEEIERGWHVTAQCTAEGSDWALDERYIVAGDRMVRGLESGVALPYGRCE